MTERSGPFWEAALGRAPMPRAAATLGLEFIDFDAETATIDLAFTATQDFTNPTGNVLGAFLAAMLYDSVGPALLATLQPDQFQSTLEPKASFLRPAQPGRIFGRGRVVHRHGDLAFLEAALTSSDWGGSHHRHGLRPGHPAQRGAGRLTASRLSCRRLPRGAAHPRQRARCWPAASRTRRPPRSGRAGPSTA
jgi:uncharacterized protein (TIGR00369 family)